MDQAHTARPRLIFLVATGLGCLSAIQASQAFALLGEAPRPFVTLLGLNLGYWYAWALLTPLVLWLARRFPLDRERWKRSLPVHVLAVLLVTYAHVVLAESSTVQVMSLTGQAMNVRFPFWERIQRNYVMSFDWEMATYWAIIGFSHAAAYYRQAQDRTLRASQLETRLAEAQLQALQRQLHPHFLFNTLNAISALMHRDVEAADQMLSRLSDLLRMALDLRGTQEVSLKEELEFLAKYLEIEQARFGDRLTVHFDVDPSTLDARVPNLLLQPLVENSVRHAVAARVESGRIEVRARRAGDRLELQVADNGPGLQNGRLPLAGKGVGLANTRMRLEHLYGAAQTLRFSEPPGGGLAVTVSMQFRADEPAEPVDDLEDIKGVA